eukprot:TRINITY_DN22125_c1_g1_i2.p1 TRINITY_DN22125_c1_g1~~TRINITY_DN22125_c1_g1_i2.p1  ORF type:complete len:518 (+),score=130.54 TRINITY_DN22125_c1_g1_i2:51-1556(+)
MFRSLVTLGAASAVSAADGWFDLFQPPFTTTPLQLMMGVSCPALGSCYLVGGDTNTGFGIYKASDIHFSSVEKLPIGSPEPSLMLLGIAMGDSTHGVAGGVELGVGGTYYTHNGKYFNESIEAGIVTTQALYSMGGAKYGYVGEYNSHQGPAVSEDGGITFKGKWWPKGFSPEAPARYGAFPSSEVIYVTGGTWPQQNNTPPTTVHISSRLRFNRQNSKFERGTLQNTTGQYTALISKSSDGGATWEKQFTGTGEFYFNGISCASETVCMAVGEGFSDDGSTSPGARVYKTEDGKTWKLIYTYGQSTHGSVLDVKMLSETEAWVGTTFSQGTFNSGAEFLHTTDGGKTFVVSPKVSAIGDVMGMSFINSTTAYAAAVTVEQVSTVLAYGITAPPPGPAPVPAGSFEQSQCENQNCSVLCRVARFQQNTCLQAQTGSAIVNCINNGTQVNVTSFELSNCVGKGKSEIQGANTCEKSTSGNYFENLCPSEPTLGAVDGLRFMF